MDPESVVKSKEKFGGDSSSCYSTSSSLVPRIEKSASARPRPNKRLLCDHCNQYLAPKTFKKHRKLYLKSDGTWIDDDTECSETAAVVHDFQSPRMPSFLDSEMAHEHIEDSSDPSLLTESCLHEDKDDNCFDCDYEDNETWEDIEEVGLCHDQGPCQPSFEDSNNPMSIKAKALSLWIIGFLLRLHSRYFIPEAALDSLLKFLYILFTILARFSPICEEIKKRFPHSLHDTSHLPVYDNFFIKYVVCCKCNFLYHFDEAVNVVGTQQTSKTCSHVLYPNHPYRSYRNPCHTLLLKSVTTTTGKKFLYPFKLYCYKTLKSSLAKLLLLPNFFSECQSWRLKSSLHRTYRDVYDGRIWKDYQTISEIPFLASESSLALMLNVDWFEPFSHTKYPVGVMYLVVMNLPRHLRFKRENIILVGIIPGPSEPKHNINSFLQPLVQELVQFWTGVPMQVQTTAGIVEKTVRCALLSVACDLPAGRKACGFLGCSARLGCSKCLKKFPGEPGNMDYSGFERSSWPLRTANQHRESIEIIKQCRTKTDQATTESSLGCRYSVLLDLPYFDAPRQLIIDPMHNLFLGTGKHMIEVWIRNEYLTDSDFQAIQTFVDKMVLPSDIGRIPYKIQSGFASFKADQFKSWITVYSIPSLFGILPKDHLECWRQYVLACRIVCKQELTQDDIALADALLLQFCKRAEQLYGKHIVTPNMHMHCHLKDVMLDYGPIQEFWLFSFERFNGILGNQPTNNRSVEQQLMLRFLKDNIAHSFQFPTDFAPDFSTLPLTERVMGSVLDTMTLQTFKLPSKYSRGVFDSEEIMALEALYSKLYPRAPKITANSMFLKYSSVVLKGKQFGSVGKGTHTSKACISLALWDSHLYSDPPTTLPSSNTLIPSRYRPVRVERYVKAFFSSSESSSDSFPNEILLAQVSWFYPSPYRYDLGKPAEIWSDFFESFGIHTFVPLQASHITCRCASGHMLYKRESVLVIVPLVE